MTSNDFDITKLAYKKINDKYSKAKYLDIECIIDMTTGYINATKFCASVSNGKTLNKYLVLNRCKNLVKYLEQHDLSGSSVSVLIKDNTSSNELRGTYVHSDLLFDIASWISPIVFLKVIKIVNEWRLLSPENEIRFHKDIGDAIKEGVGIFKNNDSESIIRDKIALEENGVIEVETPVGFIDILTDTKIIEVKSEHLWKHALGQVKCYGYYYPNHKKYIYLYNSKDSDIKNMINNICLHENVTVTYI
jgi:hypothetical protein